MGKIILTEEVRKKMFGIAPFNCNFTTDFIPESYEKKEIPKEYIPIFTLSIITVEEKRVISSKKNSDSSAESEESLKEIVRKHISNWKNVFDVGSMEEIPYKSCISGGVEKEIFDALPISIVTELFLFLLKISGLNGLELRGLKY